MSDGAYNTGLTAMSIVVVIFGGWLVLMMLYRMASRREATARDIASLTYVLSSVLVFFVIAARTLFRWPHEATFAIIFLKMASVVAVTLWFLLGTSRRDV